MKEIILAALKDAGAALRQLHQPLSLKNLEKGALMIAACFQKGNKVLIAGNGGSLCDAMHFSEELTGFFRNKRRALPAIALCDPGHLSCVANDVGYEHVFARGLEAYGQSGDLFIGLSTSGNSLNIVKAFEKAKEMGLITMAFLGKEGGQLKGYADWELIIEGFQTSDRIQEAHMTAIHIMIELVEELLFNSSNEKLLQQIMVAVME